MAELKFTVLGKPQPAGSKRAFALPTGKVVVTDANNKAKPWQAEVRSAAIASVVATTDCDYDYFGLLTMPLGVSMTFYVQRPKSHYGSGRNADKLKDSAPPFPAGRPDALKLARGTEDALTGCVWRDDAQVVDLTIAKRYGTPERAEITIRYCPESSSLREAA